jgi:hypothetical protein
MGVMAAGRGSQQAQLAGLLAALDRSVRDIGLCAARTQSGIGRHSFAPYHAYRASIDEYHALAAVIQNILQGDGSAEADRLRALLLESERKLLTVMIRAALEFFFALSAIPNLPYGIRECFAQELRSMSAAQERLRAPEHKDRLPPELGQDLEVAEEILAEVMRKAPSLMSFDSA